MYLTQTPSSPSTHAHTFNLRSESNCFKHQNIKATYYSMLLMENLAPQILKLVPKSARQCKTLNDFKTKIKSYYPDSCHCRLFKTYVAQLYR